MKLVDTVAIIGFLNPKDGLHSKSAEHLQRVSSDDESFVPAVSLLEADLVMKVRGYTASERRVSWRALEGEIPTHKIASISVSTVLTAVELQKDGMDYFDSLIASLAKETASVVITTDKKIREVVEIEW
jgi:PIN domain nuclease of toxin-antitoxin system